MKPFGFFLLSALGATASGVSAMDLQTLVDRSPFAPPAGSVMETTTEQPGTLEFRGLAVDDSGTAYSIFDITAGKGYWLREGEDAVDGKLRVKSYNANDTQIEIEQNGKPVKLQMKRASIASAAMAAPQMPAVPQPGGGAQVRRPGNTAADAQRLEAVAAEVRRRRALRNAAAPTAAPAPAAK